MVARRRSAWRGPPPKVAEFAVRFLGTHPTQTYVAESEVHAKALASARPENRGYYVDSARRVSEWGEAPQGSLVLPPGSRRG
jgi:hypothetical protein